MLAYTCVCSTFTSTRYPCKTNNVTGKMIDNNYSSIFSAATLASGKHFDLSREVAIHTLYVSLRLGLCFWSNPLGKIETHLYNNVAQDLTPGQGPLSELYGRRIVRMQVQPPEEIQSRQPQSRM